MEHLKPLPRNTAWMESLSLMNTGPGKEPARVIGFAGEVREISRNRLPNRILVSTNKRDELASVIDTLLTNEHPRKKFASAARQTSVGPFTLQGERNGNLAVYRPLGLKM